MKFILPLVAVLTLMAVVSCGDSSEPAAAVPTATSPPALTPEENALWDRASVSYKAADGGFWGNMYDFASPNARSACDRDGYASRVGNFAELIRRFMEQSEDAKIVLRVKGVSVSEMAGTVLLEVLSDGQVLRYGEVPKHRWVMSEGEWWEEHIGWKDGCVGWKAFE